MKRLTGFFAILVFALTVSPVVASSTSDSTTNDYTATVNSDVAISFSSPTNGGTIDCNDLACQTDNSATSITADGSSMSIDVSPTSGDKAWFGAVDWLVVSSNVDWGLDVKATNGDGSGNFAGTGSTTKPLSDFTVQFGDGQGNIDASSNLDSVALSNSWTPMDLNALSPIQDGDLDARWRMTTADSLGPGTYTATINFRVEPF